MKTLIYIITDSLRLAIQATLQIQCKQQLYVYNGKVWQVWFLALTLICGSLWYTWKHHDAYVHSQTACFHTCNNYLSTSLLENSAGSSTSCAAALVHGLKLAFINGG